MESAAILHIVKQLSENGIIVGSIVSDDNSVMRAHLRHNIDPTNKSDKGKLLKWVHQPIFLTDPTHKIKVVVSHFYKLSDLLRKQSRVDKVVA